MHLVQKNLSSSDVITYSSSADLELEMFHPIKFDFLPFLFLRYRL